jgi:ubiquinone/menaquinone biosynthesis C-methylase UbiE
MPGPSEAPQRAAAAADPPPPPMPDFQHRATASEWMDDLSITDDRLETALDELRLVSRWLGGAAVSLGALASVLPARVLDVGTGGADFPAEAVRWGARNGVEVHVEGLDVNPVTLAHAAAYLDETLPPDLRPRVTLQTGDAEALPYDDATFDVAHAALFLHHFDDDAAVAVLREMGRVARVVVVNDLHRHALAYGGIRTLALASQSAMFRHDGPLSVLRAFSRAELTRLTEAAGLQGKLSWHWAFRWRFVGTRPV